MSLPRSGGILLHISSLPGPYGIGTLGQSAREFVDFLRKAGQSFWQILPLGPTGEGDSPYMSTSSAAGNALLIDLEQLAAAGLLTGSELDTARFEHPDRVDFAHLRKHKFPLLRLAFSRITRMHRREMAAFAAAHRDWLEDYALFMACLEHFGTGFYDWPEEALIRRQPEALARWREKLAEEIDYQVFLQYTFFTQWHALRNYANANGVQIIGDIPFYVSGNSVDVWTNPHLFQVDSDFRARLIAGVPPDLFSEDGQLWGNPLYRWEAHAREDYRWWCNRIRQSMAFYDVIRIDHFRGFDSYWEVPADATTAKEGAWREGPGNRLLEAFRRQIPDARFIAEDLGDLTASAVAFIRGSGLPGMRVLSDAFTDLGGNSDFLPHRCIPDCVMYTGTHDSPTFLQWLFDQASREQRRYAEDYLHLNHQEGYSWGVIAGAWASVCRLAIAPFQDVLGLGADARMNTPGTVGAHNWTWRVRREAMNDEVAHRLHHLTWLYGRLNR